MIFWNLWWPLIPVLLLFTGRLWCSICPFSSIANLLNRVFPFRMFSSEPVTKISLISAGAVFTAIMTVDTIFPIAHSAGHTLVFLLTLLSLMAIIAILFDYKTYCNAVCPFGLFARIYSRASFLKINNADTICNECKRQSWIETDPISQRSMGGGSVETRDWKFKLECLKKCNAGSVNLLFENRISLKSNYNQ